MAFLVSVGGFLPGDFDGKKSVTKAVLFLLRSLEAKRGRNGWQRKGKRLSQLIVKMPRWSFYGLYVNDIRSTEPTRSSGQGKWA